MPGDTIPFCASFLSKHPTGKSQDQTRGIVSEVSSSSSIVHLLISFPEGQADSARLLPTHQSKSYRYFVSFYDISFPLPAMESIIKGNFIIIIFARVELSDFFFFLFRFEKKRNKKWKGRTICPKIVWGKWWEGNRKRFYLIGNSNAAIRRKGFEFLSSMKMLFCLLKGAFWEIFLKTW